uniref:UDP-glycosyltransferase 91D1 n=1 Tax=Stevia rebaudiana TaxID=55670 RepID=U91D1_STERE|nr:RecName: Full=UDP-glycosyltransferase 91D1 [Stevia rebaudiana]AAR06918.1 UDP-glycosyltransferase 91D1 [Stevia rebaudiana]
MYNVTYHQNSKAMATSDSIVDDRKQLHVATFPWLAFGHILPFLQLSKLIAEKGHKVSFLSTTRNIQRLSSHISPLINVVQLTLPRVQELPEDAEATTDVHPEDIQYLKKAVDGLQPEVTRFLEQHSPDWIIYDFTHYWLPSIAASLGISRAYFCVITPWTIAYLAPSSDAMINDSDGRTTVEDLTTPPKWFPFPTKVCWRKHDLARMEPYEAPGISDGYRMGMVFKGSDCLLFKCYHEFGTQWLPLLETLHQVPVVPVGLLPPEIPGDEKDETWVSIKKWLDGKQKGSVVYVALGSEALVSQTEVVELALGLELSGLPFVWAYRKPKGPAKSDSVELPDGFVERTRDRGLVWTSWAPQLRILSHESVCGFLTHCGSGSIVEGLMFGHPLIMLPIFCDQPLNARLLEDKQVGIEIPRNEEDGCLTKESVARSLRSVVVENEGEIYKANARALSKIYNDTKVEKEYVSQFVDYLEKNARAVAIDHES